MSARRPLGTAAAVAFLLSLAVLAPREGGARLPEARGGDDASTDGPLDEACDVGILLSGRELGVLKPCGCTEPQRGGLERRAVVAARARARARAFAAISLGETAGPGGGEPAQEGFKADLFRATLERIGYAGHLLGPGDLESLVDSLLAPYGAPSSDPRPPMNVLLRRDGPLAACARTDPVLRVTLGAGPTATRVRAIALADQGDLRARLAPYAAAETVLAAPTALAALPREPGLLLVAAHVGASDLAEIAALAAARADVAVVVDLRGDTAGRAPIRRRTTTGASGRALVVSFDDRGKEVGWLRLHLDGPSPSASYDAIALDPAPFERPDDPAYADVSALFAAYRRRVRDDGVLERVPSLAERDGAPRYVGSAACTACHPGIHASWAATSHAHAMATLVRADADADPECVRCHTVGWARADRGRWTRRASSFRSAARTPGLVDVGCEVCHGPGSAHVASPDRRDLFAAPDAAPADALMRRAPGEAACRACHDVDNSRGFQEPGAYARYLSEIDHREVTSGRTVRPGREGAAGEGMR